MKRFIIILVICCFISACSSSETKTYNKYYCPICDEITDYKVDPDKAIDWLEKLGYVVLQDDEVGEFAWGVFLDDREFMGDFVCDYGVEYLSNEGWTVVPPDENVWDYIQPDYHPVNEKCVYWVDSGYAYHSVKDCIALAHSSNIRSGTLEQAKQSGHDHPCSKCVGQEQ